MTVLEISGQLGETVVKQYVEDNVVCPPILRKGLFTTSALDNIDHNPTVTTSSTSFHGKSISLFQHPSSDNEGGARILPSSSSKMDGGWARNKQVGGELRNSIGE